MKKFVENSNLEFRVTALETGMAEVKAELTTYPPPMRGVEEVDTIVGELLLSAVKDIRDNTKNNT